MPDRTLWQEQKDALDALLLDLPQLLPPLFPVVPVQLAEQRGPVERFISPYHTRPSRVIELVFNIGGKPWSHPLPYPRDDGLFVIDGEVRYLPPRFWIDAREDGGLYITPLGKRLMAQVSEEWERVQARGIPGDRGVVAVLRRAFSALFEPGRRVFILRDRQNALAHVTAEREIRLYGLSDLAPVWHYAAGVLDPVQSTDKPGLTGRMRVACPAFSLTNPSSLLSRNPMIPQSWLGPTLSGIPFVQLNKPVRLFMGVKMACEADALVHGEKPLVTTYFGHARLWNGLGVNLRTAWLPWGGHTYEDAIVVSRSAADALRAMRIKKRRFRIYTEAPVNASITNDRYERGIIREGQRVRYGDPLVMLRRRRTRLPCLAEQNDLSRQGKYLSLDSYMKESWPDVIPSPYDGIIQDVEEPVPVPEGQRALNGIEATMRVTFEHDLHFSVGDKLTNRYGNKGVVSLIVPDEEMPVLAATGEHVQVLVNPDGVLRRQNFGQIIEALASWALKPGERYETQDPFSLMGHDEFQELMRCTDHEHLNRRTLLSHWDVAEYLNQLRKKWPTDVLDERCMAEVIVHGEKRRCHAGLNFWFRPGHAAVDHYSVRARGEYGQVSGQAVAGKDCDQGQRLGRMEIDCLAAHDVPGLMRELLALRSDAVDERQEFYKTGQMPEVKVGSSRAFQNLSDFLTGIGFRLVGRDQHDKVIPDLASADPSDVATITLDRLGEADIPSAWRRVPELEKDHGNQRIIACSYCARDTLVLDCGEDFEHPITDGPLRHIVLVPGRLRPAVPDLGLNGDLTQLYSNPRPKWDLAKNAEKPWGVGLYERVQLLLNKPGSDELRKAVQAAIRKAAWEIVRMLSGPNGFVDELLLGRRVDYSGRAVIVPDPSLGLDECRLPPGMVTALFPQRLGPKNPADRMVLLARQPSLHRLNILAFRVREAPDDAKVIRVHPIVVHPFGGDFDGDTMAVFAVLSAMDEALRLLPSRNFLLPGHDGLAFHAKKDVRAGLGQAATRIEHEFRDAWVAAAGDGQAQEAVAKNWVETVGHAFDSFSAMPSPDLIHEMNDYLTNTVFEGKQFNLPVMVFAYCQLASSELAKFAAEHDALGLIGGASMALMALAGGLRVTSEDCGNTGLRRVHRCQENRGICARCYGSDISTGQPVRVGVPVGIIAVQALMECAQDMCLKASKTDNKSIDPMIVRKRVSRLRKLKRQRNLLRETLRLYCLFVQAHRDGMTSAIPDRKHFLTVCRAVHQAKNERPWLTELLARMARSSQGKVRGVGKRIREVLGKPDSLLSHISRLIIGQF